MKKVLFFDLDGTLLPLDMDDFMKSYFTGVSKKFVELGLPVKEATQAFMISTQKMVDNDGTKTNEQAFWDSFSSLIEFDYPTVHETFKKFYETEFQDYKSHTQAVVGLNEALRKLKDKGHRLFLATNPLFPDIATYSRIKWAGLDADLFEEISTYEHYHACKPNLAYYQEMIEKFNLDPADILMVGNDAQEDLVVKELGIETYLITDHLLDRSNGNYQADHQGSMSDFLEYITQS